MGRLRKAEVYSAEVPVKMPITAVTELFKVLTNKRLKLPRDNLDGGSAETESADS